MSALQVSLVVIGFAFMVYGVIDVLRTPAHEVKVVHKATWLLAVLLLPILGTVMWLMWGCQGIRPARTQNTTPPAQKAPDDDAEFLRNLRIRRALDAKEAQLRQREEQLRLREEQLRMRDQRRGEDEAPGPTA